jgi:hypothetical protein
MHSCILLSFLERKEQLRVVVRVGRVFEYSWKFLDDVSQTTSVKKKKKKRKKKRKSKKLKRFVQPNLSAVLFCCS